MKKNLTIPALILGLGFSGNAYPMAGIAAYFTKESLKKAIEKVTTGVHWGISVGPIWGNYAYILTQFEKEKKNIRAEDPFEINGKYPLGDRWYTKEKYLEKIKKQEEWIRQELKLLGYNNWKTVDLVPFLSFITFGDFRTKSLFYDKHAIADANDEQCPSNKQFSILNWIFSKPVENKKEKYNELRAILSHEISHLTNNDSEKAMVIGATMPFITHLISKKIASLANLPIPNFALKNSLKILSGIGKLGISYASNQVYWNFAEKKADENVINDIEILEAAARNMRKNASLPDTKNLSWQERFWRLIDVHEDSLKRAQRFEERIAELKKSIVSQKSASEQKVSPIKNQAQKQVSIERLEQQKVSSIKNQKQEQATVKQMRPWRDA
jgi:peptidase M48-like protein